MDVIAGSGNVNITGPINNTSTSGATSGLTVANTGTTGFSGLSSYTGAFSQTGNGTVNLSGTMNGPASVTINSPSATFNETSAGAIQGAGTTFTLTTGTAILAGGNTYGGATAVNGGKLILANAGNLGNTAVTVTGATLAVTQNTNSASNTIGGSLTMNAGSALTMLDSQTNTLYVAGNANLYAGTAGTAPTYTFDVSSTGTNDWLDIGGVASLSDPGATVNVNLIGTAANYFAGELFTLVTGGAGSSWAPTA